MGIKNREVFSENRLAIDHRFGKKAPEKGIFSWSLSYWHLLEAAFPISPEVQGQVVRFFICRLDNCDAKLAKSPIQVNRKI
jgi:hypothetical protein